MTARLFIAIPVHNRLNIAEECVPTVRSGMVHGHDVLRIYDDGSVPAVGDRRKLIACSDDIKTYQAEGVERQRRIHFIDFGNNIWSKYTHLYLTDADAPHDPEWRTRLLALQDEHGGAPVCGYNTAAHADIPGNTLGDDPASTVIWRRSAPGVSYLLTCEHVAKVCAALPSLPEHWNWDWTVPQILGSRFAIARQSVVSHIGYGGYHHPVDAGWDGGDVPLNPTPWLAAKRADIIARLKAKQSP